MARWRFLKAKVGMALAGAFGLTALAVSVPLVATTASSVSSTNVVTTAKSDVSSTWNFECPAGSVCAPEWNETLNLPVTSPLPYDEQGAKTAFANITKWADFQRDFVSSNSSSYKSIVWNNETYSDYYLPPHKKAGTATAEWERIYNDLNTKAETAYAAAVKPDVDALIAANVTNTFTFNSSEVPQGEFKIGGTKIDFRATLENYFGTGFLQESGLAQWITDALKAGTGLGDVNDYLTTAQYTAWANFADYLNNFYTSLRTALDKDLYFVANGTPRELSVAALRNDFAKDLNILASLTDETWQGVSSEDAVLAKKLALRQWTPEAIYDAMKVANLQSKSSTLFFSAATPQSWNDVASFYRNFGSALRMVDTVDKTFRLDSNDSRDIDDYGPFSVAQMAVAALELANTSRSFNSSNPSLSELYDEQAAITGSQLFTKDKTDGYFDGVLTNLLNNVNLAPAFVALVNERVPQADRTPALNETTGKISTDGLYYDYVNEALSEIKAIYYHKDLTTFGVLIGVGALMGLVGTVAAYASVRGYIVKRRYGVKIWEYVKSRAIVSAIAVTGVAAAVAMVIAAIIGVV